MIKIIISPISKQRPDSKPPLPTKQENKIKGMWINEARHIPDDLIQKLSKKMKPVEIITTEGNDKFDWYKFLDENERLRDGKQ